MALLSQFRCSGSDGYISWLDDVLEIDGFGMSWNLGNTSTWAIDQESVNEVGCIYTSQGLEFEYVGVIIG